MTYRRYWRLAFQLHEEITQRNDLFTGELMAMARRVGMLEAQLE